MLVFLSYKYFYASWIEMDMKESLKEESLTVQVGKEEGKKDVEQNYISN